jgi:hypothetical protein
MKQLYEWINGKLAPVGQQESDVWKYGKFESFPAVYNDERGFVLFVEEDGWRELPLSEIHGNAGMLSKSVFDARFPNLPPLPLPLSGDFDSKCRGSSPAAPTGQSVSNAWGIGSRSKCHEMGRPRSRRPAWRSGQRGRPASRQAANRFP